MINKVILVGRLTADPIPSVTSSGLNQSTFSIAVENEMNYKNSVYFFNCIAWRHNANFLNQYCKKGNLIFIEGKLTTDNYVTNDGRKIKNWNIIVDSVKILSKANELNNRNSIDNQSYNKQYNQSNNFNSIKNERNYSNKNFDKFNNDSTPIDNVFEEPIFNGNWSQKPTKNEEISQDFESDTKQLTDEDLNNKSLYQDNDHNSWTNSKNDDELDDDDESITLDYLDEF